MKNLLIIFALCLTSVLHAQSFFQKADKFFAANVKDGAVDYKSIKADPAQLNDLVKFIAELDLSNKRVTPDFLKAFYINAYNILVIKEVVDLYPIQGPLAAEGFFNGIKHTVMGTEMTLDELEKQTLYKQFPDARLHFVLVCAAKGCPPLVGYSYKPEGLEVQLQERTEEVLNLDWFIRVNKNKIELSKIFEWYKGDFVKSKGSVIKWINQYKNPELSTEMKIGYYEYDWSLNAQ